MGLDKNIVRGHAFNSVVIAKVAILLLESVIRFSISKLQVDTAPLCVMATCTVTVKHNELTPGVVAKLRCSN